MQAQHVVLPPVHTEKKVRQQLGDLVEEYNNTENKYRVEPGDDGLHTHKNLERVTVTEDADDPKKCWVCMKDFADGEICVKYEFDDS